MPRSPPGSGSQQRSRPICRGLLAYGIVAVHDLAQLVPDVDLTGGIAIVRDLADGGRLPVRVHASIRTEALGAAIEGGLKSGAPLGESDRARFGWLKIFGDGSLFSRTAFLLEPWESDDERGAPPTGPRGLPTTTAAEMAELARRAAAAGIATAIHAIGDATVRAALDALAPVAGATTIPNRIEHLQFVDPSDIGRFGELGVVASVQPIHLRGDARWARVGLGDRAERIGYPWRAVASRGGLLAFGADAPYEDIDPWPGLAMAVTRRDPSWPPGDVFGAYEALTLDIGGSRPLSPSGPGRRRARPGTAGPRLLGGPDDRPGGERRGADAPWAARCRQLARGSSWRPAGSPSSVKGRSADQHRRCV